MQLTPPPSETPFSNYTFTQVIMPNPMYVSCCWLIFNLKNISLQKEDAGGRVCCIKGLLWMQVLKMGSAKKAAGVGTPRGAWMNKTPC